MIKTDSRSYELSKEQNDLYATCCKELGLNPKRINQIQKAPSYQKYYEKSKEFLSYITGKTITGKFSPAL